MKKGFELSSISACFYLKKIKFLLDSIFNLIAWMVLLLLFLLQLQWLCFYYYFLHRLCFYYYFCRDDMDYFFITISVWMTLIVLLLLFLLGWHGLCFYCAELKGIVLLLWKKLENNPSLPLQSARDKGCCLSNGLSQRFKLLIALIRFNFWIHIGIVIGLLCYSCSSSSSKRQVAYQLLNQDNCAQGCQLNEASNSAQGSQLTEASDHS